MSDEKEYTAEELVGLSIQHLENGRETLLESGCPECEERTIAVDIHLERVEACLRNAMGCLRPRKSDPS